MTRRRAGEVPIAARLPDPPVENSRLWRHSARVSPTEFLRRQAPQKLLMGYAARPRRRIGIVAARRAANPPYDIRFSKNTPIRSIAWRPSGRMRA